MYTNFEALAFSSSYGGSECSNANAANSFNTHRESKLNDATNLPVCTSWYSAHNKHTERRSNNDTRKRGADLKEQ